MSISKLAQDWRRFEYLVFSRTSDGSVYFWNGRRGWTKDHDFYHAFSSWQSAKNCIKRRQKKYSGERVENMKFCQREDMFNDDGTLKPEFENKQG